MKTTAAATLPPPGSGLELNGKPVDWKTLNPHSIADYNGVLATPEEYAAAQAAANNSVNSTGGGYSAAQLPSASTAESYINNWTDAQIAAAQQGLKTAYDENMNALNAAGEKIPALYETARNQTAAQSEVQRGNFNQYASASGLNSGAGGQAQLAIGNQLQGDLSGITQAEANAKAELELQRTQLATQYQNDIAQAVAGGKLQEANALYQEYIRIDDSIVQTAITQENINANAYGINANQYSVNRSAALDYASYTGDFSGMAAYHWTPQMIATAHQQWLDDMMA